MGMGANTFSFPTGLPRLRLLSTEPVCSGSYLWTGLAASRIVRCLFLNINDKGVYSQRKSAPWMKCSSP